MTKPENKPTLTSQITALSLDLIDDPPKAVRTELDDASINDLAADIKRNGLIEPVIVRPVGERFEIVAGHRRFTAMKRTGAVKINAIVRKLTDKEATGIKLSENLHRKDIDLLEEAAFFAEYISEELGTVADISQMIGRSEEYILGRLEIINFPPFLQDALQLKQMPLGAAQQLVRIDDLREMETLVKYAVQGGITIRQAENWVENYFAQKASGAVQVYMDAQPDAIRAAAEPLIVCERCLTGGFMRDLRTALVHRGACPERVARVEE